MRKNGVSKLSGVFWSFLQFHSVYQKCIALLLSFCIFLLPGLLVVYNHSIFHRYVFVFILIVYNSDLFFSSMKRPFLTHWSHLVPSVLFSILKTACNNNHLVYIVSQRFPIDYLFPIPVVETSCIFFWVQSSFQKLAIIRVCLYFKPLIH